MHPVINPVTMSARAALFIFATIAAAPAAQWVEGFDQPVFHHEGMRYPDALDFRGMSRGYMTAGWHSPAQLKENVLSWKTAVVPAKEPTTFAFIGATSVLPSEFSRGPQVKLFVNGKYALTFSIGFTRDVTWKEGEFELKYISKRVEYPYTGSHRQFELYGNSGLFHLSVPASAIEAGQPATIRVDVQPFEGWKHGWFTVKERRDVLKQSQETLQGEVDALRHDMAVVAMQTQALATQVYADLLGRDRFKHDVLYANGHRHVHPADLIKLKNGELLLMWREGTEHVSVDGDVVMVRSKDGGRTWGDRQVIAGIEGLDEREGCGLQLSDGTIVVGVFFNKFYYPNGNYMPTPERQARLDKPGQTDLGSYIITSKDNGRSWSKANYIKTAGMPYSSVEGPTDAPIEMPDGSVIMAIIGYSPHGDKGNRAAALIRSTDQGKTWKHVSMIATDPGAKLGGFMEPGIVRTKTGRLVVAMRNHGTEQAIWVTHSDDDGKTWAPVKQTAMIGHPVDLIELKDGRLLASYGIRPGSHTTPGGIRVCFSKDNGVTWDIATEVQLRNDFLGRDIGYPESIQNGDGSVLTVYYYNLFNKYFIGGTTWTP